MIDFDNMITNYIKSERKPKVIGRYYPSEIGSCLRKIWFSYKYPKETKDSLLKIFFIGELIHNFVADVFKSEKNPSVDLVGEEVPFELKMKDYIISGRVDDIILLKPENKKVLIEVKSIGNLNGIKDAKAQHKMQLQLYMFATKIREGLILYVDKKNMKSKIFNIKYDEGKALSILERFSILHNYLLDDIIPEPEAKINPEMSWMCRYCEYKDECNKIDGVVINEKK